MTQAICRLCLAIEVRMVTIADTPLQAVFKKITDNLLHTTDRRPVAACYFCCAQLQKCHKLMLRSARAENLLTGILQRQPEVTMKSVALIDRKVSRLCEPLSIVTLDGVDQVMPTSIAVKNERALGSPELVLVKTEMEYEEGSPQQLDIEEHSPTEGTRILSESKEELESPVTDAISVLEVEIDIGQDGASQIPFDQQAASTPGNQQNDEITFMNQQDPLNMNTKTGEKFFECTHCHRKFKWKQCLERHVVTHTGEKPYKCDVCQRQFSQAHHLRDHLRTHTGERLHKCNICNVNFRILSSLKRHFNRVHTGEKLYKCNVCKRQFEYQKTYHSHLKSHYSEPKTIHECDICHRRFEKKYHLQRHAKVHTGEKPHECTMCGRRFSEKRNMLTHVKTHYIEKPPDYCSE